MEKRVEYCLEKSEFEAVKQKLTERGYYIEESRKGLIYRSLEERNQNFVGNLIGHFKLKETPLRVIYTSDKELEKIIDSLSTKV